MKPAVFSLCVVISLGLQAQQFSWVDQFGGTLADRITSMVTDASGNAYVTGQFEGTMDADPGPGVYNLTSAGGSDTFIAKLSPGGALIWARQIEGSSTYTGEGGNGIAVGQSGDVYVTGRFIGTVDFDLGAGEFFMVSAPPAYESQYCVPWADVFILKLTPGGDFIWARQVGGNGNDEVTSIVLDPAEHVYVTGEYVSEGNPGPPVDMDPGVGTFYLTSLNGSAAFLLKLDVDGGFIWAKQWYSTGIAAGGCGLRDAMVHPMSLCLDGIGNIHCTGDFGSTVDFDPNGGTYSISTLSNAAFVIKLDSDGAFQWARALNNAGNHAYGKDVIVGLDGYVYSVGNFDGTIDFDPGSGIKNLKAPGSSGTSGIGPSDAYVWILNSMGNYVWAGQMGGNTGDGASSIDLDGSGNMVVTGSFTGTGDFNPASAKNTLKSAGSADVFVAKLTVSGGYVWAGRIGGTLADNATAVDLDASDAILTAGTFQGTADFNPASATAWRTSFGTTDGFLVKLTQGGPAINQDEEIVSRSISPEIRVFPNPAIDHVMITFAAPRDMAYEVLIMDQQGRSILRQTGAVPMGQQQAELQFGSLPAGTYHLVLQLDGKRLARTIVVR